MQYAQIEKELLAIVFGMEKFEGYTYGRKVLVDTDHKPLESIMKKGLLSAPKRLQCMLLRLQKLDIEVTYKKGTETYIADTLSRAYLPMTGCESQGDSEDVMLTDIHHFFRCSPRGFSATCLQQMQGSVVEGLSQTATSGSQWFFV